MTLLGDALKMPIITLGRYLAGENPGAVDPARDALRIAKGCGPSIVLFGTEAVPVDVGVSGGRVVLNSIPTDMASVVTFYLQLNADSDATSAQLGLQIEASHDGVTFYPVPFIGPVDETTTIFSDTDGGSGPPPTDGGFVDAGETSNRALYVDVVYFPVQAAAWITEGAPRSAMRAIPVTVRGYRAIRGVLLPLFVTAGGNPTASVVANVVT